MNLTGNTILVTGGATGIGWAIARRFIEAGNVVIARGRRAEAQAREPKTLGVPLEEFGDGVWAGLEAGKPEFGYGSSEARRLASREELDKHVANLAAMKP